jgi:hypothetical protein
MHSVNAGDTGPNRWWQQVLAFGCLPETRDQSETAPKSSVPTAFIVMP